MDTVNFTNKSHSDRCAVGDIFLIDSDPYMLVQVDGRKLSLIEFENGTRWDEPFEMYPKSDDSIFYYTLNSVINEIKRDDDPSDITRVEYVGACKITIDKEWWNDWCNWIY